MATVVYHSLQDAEIIDLDFLTLQGEVRKQRLLVDTGFTGKSSLVLSRDAVDLFRAMLPATQAAGALHGSQDRAWVTCTIPELGFHRTVIAIVTDISQLSLPTGLQGMAGLSFLRLFHA